MSSLKPNKLKPKAVHEEKSESISLLNFLSFLKITMSMPHMWFYLRLQYFVISMTFMHINAFIFLFILFDKIHPAMFLF